MNPTIITYLHTLVACFCIGVVSFIVGYTTNIPQSLKQSFSVIENTEGLTINDTLVGQSQYALHSRDRVSTQERGVNLILNDFTQVSMEAHTTILLKEISQDVAIHLIKGEITVRSVSNVVVTVQDYMVSVHGGNTLISLQDSGNIIVDHGIGYAIVRHATLEYSPDQKRRYTFPKNGIYNSKSISAQKFDQELISRPSYREILPLVQKKQSVVKNIFSYPALFAFSPVAQEKQHARLQEQEKQEFLQQRTKETITPLVTATKKYLSSQGVDSYTSLFLPWTQNRVSDFVLHSLLRPQDTVLHGLVIFTRSQKIETEVLEYMNTWIANQITLLEKASKEEAESIFSRLFRSYIAVVHAFETYSYMRTNTGLNLLQALEKPLLSYAKDQKRFYEVSLVSLNNNNNIFTLLIQERNTPLASRVYNEFSLFTTSRLGSLDTPSFQAYVQNIRTYQQYALEYQETYYGSAMDQSFEDFIESRNISLQEMTRIDDVHTFPVAFIDTNKVIQDLKERGLETTQKSIVPLSSNNPSVFVQAFIKISENNTPLEFTYFPGVKMVSQIHSQEQLFDPIIESIPLSSLSEAISQSLKKKQKQEDVIYDEYFIADWSEYAQKPVSELDVLRKLETEKYLRTVEIQGFPRNMSVHDMNMVVYDAEMRVPLEKEKTHKALMNILISIDSKMFLDIRFPELFSRSIALPDQTDKKRFVAELQAIYLQEKAEYELLQETLNDFKHITNGEIQDFHVTHREIDESIVYISDLDLYLENKEGMFKAELSGKYNPKTNSILSGRVKVETFVFIVENISLGSLENFINAKYTESSEQKEATDLLHGIDFEELFNTRQERSERSLWF